MATDLILAILHHLLVFALFAIFAIQMVLVRRGLDGAGIGRLARIDAVYGATSAAVLVVGFARVFWGLKGWDYYSGYWVFWAKIAAFVLVGLLSIRPTLAYRRWLGAARAAASYTVPEPEIAGVRGWLHREAFVLTLIPVLAAMMARGVFY